MATPTRLTLQTPFDEMSVRASAREAPCELRILCLEDLSAISEQELMMKRAIGVSTVTRLREVLGCVGLDFLSDPNAGMMTSQGFPH